MSRPAEVLFAVERGWRGARECSRTLSRQGIAVTHVVKGWAPKEVRALVTPLPFVRMVWVPRWWFRLPLWVLLVAGSLRRRVRWVVVDHERTLREVSGWCKRTGVTLLWMQEHEHGYQLLNNGQPIPDTSEFWRAG